MDETTSRTRSYRTSLTPRHLLGLPVVLMLLLSLLGVASAQTPEASPAANATPANTSTPGIALISNVSPGTASGTNQIVLTQNVVVNGAGASWTIETPLTDKLTYRDATCAADGTQKTTCENTFDAGTSTVTTTGTLDADASFGQARVRIVLAVQGGSQATDLEIVSNATSGSAADSATAFLKILGAPAPAVIVSTTIPTATTEATVEAATETPTEVATETPAATDEATTAATPATSDTDTAAPTGASGAIALVSSLSPATASGTDQVILTQNVVIQGEGSAWTLTTPLTGDILYRSASCSPAGTQGTSCENTFDAVTNSVITTGTLEDGASFGQARVRIVTTVEGGKQPQKIVVESNATAGDASDDATAFLNVVGPEVAIVAPGNQTSTTTEADVTPETKAAADTPTESASTPAPAEEATAEAAQPESSPATTQEATVAPVVETATEPEAETAETSAEPTAEGEHEGEGEAAEGEEEDTDNTTTILIIVGIVAVVGIGSALGILKNLRDGGPTSTKK